MQTEKWEQPKMEHGKLTKWYWLPYHPRYIDIGKNVDIGAFTFLQGACGITIEDDVQIGSHCSIYSWDSERKICGSILIKKGVRIGAHSVILPKKDQVHIIDKNIKAGSIIY